MKRCCKKSASKTSNSSSKIPSPLELSFYTIFVSTLKVESSKSCNKTGNTWRYSSLTVVSLEKVSIKSWTSSDTPKNMEFSVKTPLTAYTLPTPTSFSSPSVWASKTSAWSSKTQAVQWVQTGQPPLFTVRQSLNNSSSWWSTYCGSISKSSLGTSWRKWRDQRFSRSLTIWYCWWRLWVTTFCHWSFVSLWRIITLRTCLSVTRLTLRRIRFLSTIGGRSIGTRCINYLK